MSQAPSSQPTGPRPPQEPAWDIARIFPDQGAWSAEDYFALNTNRLVEFSHGVVEVLPMPTLSHQLIVQFLFGLLRAFLAAGDRGTVVIAPYRMRLWAGKYREPDLIVVLAEHVARMTEEYTDGADVVFEVVSPENRHHDLETKRSEYARAGIPEYWIVDPQQGHIVVLRLEGTGYAVHGTFERGSRAGSHLLPGFEVDVTAALAAGR